jgi:hypothetical protein
MQNSLVAAVAAIAATAAPAAQAYSALANVTFNWAESGVVRGWTANGSNIFVGAGAPTGAGTFRNTWFSNLIGNNAVSWINPDFATPADLSALGCPIEPVFVAQYACKISNGGPNGNGTLAKPFGESGNAGPGGRATGSLTVTDTTLTGILTVINTNDEGAGIQSGTTAATGYNVRTADGSPFRNVWYGVSSSTTLSVNLTGTFSATSWFINGGTVSFFDPQFQCAVADFSGTLCASSTVGGGFRPNGQFLSWGLDQAFGPLTPAGEIPVFDSSGTTFLDSIGGVLATLSIDSAGNIVTNQGEFRQGATTIFPVSCPQSIRYNGFGLSCGVLQVGTLDIRGQVVPVPAAAWLFAGALAALAGLRRGPRD